MRTFIIELRVDDSEPERVKHVETAAKVAAKHLFTTALLLAPDDKPHRKPQIMLTAGDTLVSEQEISLADDLE